MIDAIIRKAVEHVKNSFEKGKTEGAAKRSSRAKQPSRNSGGILENVVDVVEDVAGFKDSYVVQSGDSLSAIAQRFYGDAGRWPEIFQANTNQISNPDLIYPGMELVIP